jgi:hypothetical protein
VGVELEDSRTMYEKPRLSVWKRLLREDEGLGSDSDPNAPIPLCRPCAKEHHENMTDQWAVLQNGWL